jgi:hypothetical protein
MIFKFDLIFLFKIELLKRLIIFNNWLEWTNQVLTKEDDVTSAD